jgi:thiamine biosynthesis lipoprotein
VDHRRLKIWLLLLPGLSLVLLTAGYWLWANRQQTVTKSQFLLGTIVEITATGKAPEKAVTAAFREIRRIEKLISSRPGSDVARISQGAGVKAVPVSPDTLAILKLIRADYQLLAGAFDPTVAPLVELWGFGYEGAPRLPAKAAIQRLLPLVAFNQVRIDQTAGTVMLAKPGMKLDLGGVAKGYALDRAYQGLRRAGIKSALINGGSSSIRVVGDRFDHRPWQIGIGHPRRPQKLLGQLTLPNDSALGVSADTQNFFIKDQKRYSHLLNPRTGYPAQDKMLVAVTAPTAAAADMLSTACFILPLDRIKRIIAQRPNIKVIIVDQTQRVLNLNNPDFQK